MIGPPESKRPAAGAPGLRVNNLLGRTLAVSGAGVAYLAGGFSGAADFGGTRLVSHGSTDGFIWRVGTCKRN
jgi:hypothetical protein